MQRKILPVDEMVRNILSDLVKVRSLGYERLGTSRASLLVRPSLVISSPGDGLIIAVLLNCSL